MQLLKTIGKHHGSTIFSYLKVHGVPGMEVCPGISTFLYYCKNHYVLLIDLSLQDPSSVQKLGQKLDHILSCFSTVI